MNSQLISIWSRVGLAALIITLLSIGTVMLPQSTKAASLESTFQQTELGLTHRVGAGDTLARLAREYGTTVSELLRLNPQITNPNRIFLGQIIVIGVTEPSDGETSPLGPTRIQFTAGTTLATQTGTVGPNETDAYLLNAAQGQEMVVTLDAPDGNIALLISGPTGELQPLTDQVFEWRGTLPATGEYGIDIISILGIFEKRYTLTVNIVDADSGADNDADGEPEGDADDSVDAPTDDNNDVSADDPTGSTVSHTFTPQGFIDFRVRTDGDASILDLVDPTSGQVRQGFVITPETAALISESYGLIVEDMNYDGYDDFRVVEFLTAGANIPYLYYLYDPSSAQFVYNSDLRALTSPEFVGSNTILSRWQLGGANWGVDIYAYVNGQLTLLVKQEWTAISESESTHNVTLFEPEGATGSDATCRTIMGPAQPDGTTDDRVVCTSVNRGPDGPNISGGGGGPVGPIGPTAP